MRTLGRSARIACRQALRACGRPVSLRASQREVLRMLNILFDTILGAPADPGKVCMTLLGGGGITYGALIEETGRVANTLTALGVKPGDRVAVQVEKSPDVIALYLG